MTNENKERYVKIADDGALLTADASEWVAVLDTKTNLMWALEVLKRQPFKKALKATEKLKTAGFTDWRLPTVEELFCLADRTRFNPAINTDFFPDTPADWFWSSTVAASSPGVCAWYVAFYDGDSRYGSQSGKGCVRRVPEDAHSLDRPFGERDRGNARAAAGDGSQSDLREAPEGAGELPRRVRARAERLEGEAMSGRSRTPYTSCKLFYDGFESLAIGDYLKTPAGSAYLIQAVRINRNRAYRQHLECVRWPASEIPRGARVHPLHWYPRKKKRGRTLASLRSAA